MSVARIASLLASGTEILYGLGLGDRVVAVSHECDYPEEVCDKPRVTRTTISVDLPSAAIDAEVRRLTADSSGVYQIDVERLESLRPDLIVTQAHCDVCAVNYDDVVATVNNSSVLAQTKIVSLNPSTLEHIFDDIRNVSQAADCSSRGDTYVASLRRRVDYVREATSSLDESRRPRVVCIEWIEPMFVAANWMPELIEIAGGTSGITKNGVPSGTTEWSEVRAFDPEVVVVMPCGFDLKRTVRESTALESLLGWADLSATKTDRVFAVDGNAYFNRSGPRIVDSLEILAYLIHPELSFMDPKPAESVYKRLVAMKR